MKSLSSAYARSVYTCFSMFVILSAHVCNERQPLQDLDYKIQNEELSDDLSLIKPGVG